MFTDSHFEGGQNIDLPKSVHSVQTRISSSHWQVSEIITPQSLVGLRHMGNRRKAEKYSYEVSTERYDIQSRISWYDIQSGVKSSDFSERSVLSRTEFQQPSQIPKVITPKLLTVSEHANNRWKDENVFYNYCVGILVRFQPCRSRFDVIGLLFAVKSELPSVPNFSFWSSLGGVEDCHLSWCFNNMIWCSSYICDCSFLTGVSSRWLYIWGLDRIGITLKPPLTLESHGNFFRSLAHPKAPDRVILSHWFC
jgi:hypothetical protein